jgi:hypothetical protein
MLPEISVPAGSSEVPHNEPEDETWYFTTPYDQTAAMIKAQLPIGQPFRGVPFCKGDNDVKPGAEIVAWDWATDTEDLWISVTGPSLAINKNKLGEIEFRWKPVTDGSGRQQDECDLHHLAPELDGEIREVAGGHPRAGRRAHRQFLKSRRQSWPSIQVGTSIQLEKFWPTALFGVPKLPRQQRPKAAPWVLS